MSKPMRGTQPSVHTRVVAVVSSSAGSFTIETRTDSAGNYSIAGVPVANTSVRFDFYGPDDATRGAQRTVGVPDGTVGSYPGPDVKLDATGPRVVRIDPPNNANSVAPNSPVTITFTEALDADAVNSARFRVIASDDSQAAPLGLRISTAGRSQLCVALAAKSLLDATFRRRRPRSRATSSSRTARHSPAPTTPHRPSLRPAHHRR